MLILLGGIFGGSLIYSILLLFLTTLARVSGVSLLLHFHFSFSPSTQGDYVSQLDSIAWKKKTRHSISRRDNVYLIEP
jgi:hypothetical protein